MEVIAQLIEIAVLHCSVSSRENHKPGVITRLGCGLGDELRRQMVIEIAGFHPIEIISKSAHRCREQTRCLLSPPNLVIVSAWGEMDQIELVAASRDILGKKVRFLRRQGLIPANLYGHNVESTALQIEASQLKHTLTKAGRSSLIALKVDGTKSPKMVIVRDVQREPLSGELLHVDFYQVKMEEKIKLEVPLLFIGEAPAIKERGGILVQNMNSLEVECLPADMPHNIEVDLSVLEEIDQAVHVGDIHADDGVTILTDPDQAIVQIARSRVEVEIAEEIAAAEAEVEEEVEAKVEVEEEKVEAPEPTEEAAE